MASSTAAVSADEGVASLPADAISYEDLYARWERGNWSATELDFSEDARQWREDFSDFERRAAVWNYCLFFWGEDAVADNLSPYIDAAPLEEQKYFLATQQVDEARHAVFFKRFMQEVCGIGDGSTASGLQAIKPQLTPGFRKIFGRLDTMADELRADRSPAKLAAAVTLYHIVIEASLAQPGQHFICSYLEERNQLPAFRQGMDNIAADEQRHIGFGVKLLADLRRMDPEGVPPRGGGPAARSEPVHLAGADAARLGRALHHGLQRQLGRRGRGGRDVDDDQAALGGSRRRDPAGTARDPARPHAARDLQTRPRARSGGCDRRARRPLRPQPGDARAAVRHDPPPGRPAPWPPARHHVPMGLHRSRPVPLAPDGEQRVERRPGGRCAVA